MTNSVIHIENLGKQYSYGVNNSDTLREQLTNSLNSIFRRNRQARESHSLWALKDVNIDVQAGEVLGIIGHNGAGKSTLLKILSRITHPTTGKIIIHGRTASLLEVGTGFHPELTGRENVFMNAAVLGMKRSETRKKFDEIVDFAEVEQFIDTPVKRYSSGMYMRLAFAVAAHLEPEILIVDEVLAVGDIAFQKKSIGKMSDIASHGRTVLFVSHNIGAVSSLCSRAVLLNHGQVKYQGSVDETINQYINNDELNNNGQVIWEHQDQAPGEQVKLHAARIISDDKITSDISIDAPITVEFDYWNLKADATLIPAIHLRDKNGAFVLVSGNMHSANLAHDIWFDIPHPVGLYRTRVVLPGNLLNTGRYFVDVGIGNGRNFEVNQERVLYFDVHETGSMNKEFTNPWVGVIRPRLAWETEKVE